MKREKGCSEDDKTRMKNNMHIGNFIYSPPPLNALELQFSRMKGWYFMSCKWKDENYSQLCHEQRCHREHSKFPENLLRGRGGCPPSHGVELFCFQCWIVCSGAYFRGNFHIFLHIISVFNWVLATYCHMVIKKKKKKKLPFWKFPEMWQLCTSQSA